MGVGGKVVCRIYARGRTGRKRGFVVRRFVACCARYLNWISHGLGSNDVGATGKKKDAFPFLCSSSSEIEEVFLKSSYHIGLLMFGQQQQQQITNMFGNFGGGGGGGGFVSGGLPVQQQQQQHQFLSAGFGSQQPGMSLFTRNVTANVASPFGGGFFGTTTTVAKGAVPAARTAIPAVASRPQKLAPMKPTRLIDNATVASKSGGARASSSRGSRPSPHRRKLSRGGGRSSASPVIVTKFSENFDGLRVLLEASAEQEAAGSSSLDSLSKLYPEKIHKRDEVGDADEVQEQRVIDRGDEDEGGTSGGGDDGSCTSSCSD